MFAPWVLLKGKLCKVAPVVRGRFFPHMPRNDLVYLTVPAQWFLKLQKSDSFIHLVFSEPS